VADLRKFFDFYLKGVQNDWEQTPKVRLSVLNPGHEDTVNRPESTYPLQREKQQTLYLTNQNGKLEFSKTPQKHPSQVVYDSDDEDGVTFNITMPVASEYVGEFSLKLFVEADGADDMDLFAFVRKFDAQGNLLQPKVVTDRYYPGPNGRLRVSQRELDLQESTPQHLELAQTGEQKLFKDEIVSVEIPFWPFGMKWEAGETLALTICPKDKIVRPEFPELPPSPNINHGKHIIHFGGQYDAKLRLPLIVDED
jgi:predicted acyl esterase